MAITSDIREFAAKFGVSITVETFGIYGDFADYVAAPANRSHYPNVQPFRIPVGTDPKSAVRAIAERMGTGRWSPSHRNRFELAK